MTAEIKNKNNEDYDYLLQYANLNPGELLQLFNEYIFQISRKRDTQFIFKELTKHLTREEQDKLFTAWEDILIEPGEFYSVTHKLRNKFSNGV